MNQQQYIILKFGSEQGKLINKQIHSTYIELKKMCKNESKFRTKTMCSQIFPRLAMYQVLKTKLSQEKAYNIVWEYTKNYICVPVSKKYKNLEKIPFFFTLYRKIFLHIVASSDKWETIIKQNQKDCFSFDIQKCLWHETCKKCGCSELCRVFCDSDYENFGKMKKTSFFRTQTLGTGGDKCDFEFARLKEGQK